MCNLTQGFNDRVCAGSIGGIKSVIFIPVDTLTFTETDLEVQTLTSTVQVFQYKLRQNLSNFTAPPRRNENDAVWYDVTLQMRLNADSKEQRAEIHLLAKNELACIVQKADNTYVLIGAEEGLRMGTDSTYVSGTLKSDGTPTILNFLGQENNPILDVPANLVATLLSATPSPSV
jgi:hypothetical protein